MIKKFKYSATVIIFILAVFVMAGTSHASIMMTGDGSWGDFSGTMSYSASNSSSAIFIVTLINTSPVANGGYLTAFVFNNPGDKISSVSLSTDSNLKLLFGNNEIKAQPLGYFDIGAALTTNPNNAFEGGGNPSSGIGVGLTRTFTFTFGGTGLDAINEWDFVNEPSTSKDEFFIARFRGFENGQSNKTPGTVTPEPATMALLGLGIAGTMMRKRRLK